MLTIAWKGRAGQGIVTNSNVLGSAIIDIGKISKSFPSFGGERIGAPVNAFTYIDDRSMHLHCILNRVNVVSVIDPYFIHKIDVLDNLDKKGILIVNISSSYDDEYLLEKLVSNRNVSQSSESWKDLLKPLVSRIFRIDAQQQASMFFQRGQGQNIVILGATIKALQDYWENNNIPLYPKDVQKQIGVFFLEKLGKKKTDENLYLFQKGFDTVKEVKL